MTVRVEVRTTTLVKVAEIDDYDELDLRLRRNGGGTWTLKANANSPGARALAAQGHLGGIVVTRSGVPFFSGRVETPTFSGTVDGSEQMTVQGIDDTTDVLGSRLALPTPLGPPYTTEYDDHSGPAETVLRGFVDRNVGPAAKTGRRWPRFELEPDQGRGSEIRGRPNRFDGLLPFMQSAAIVGGVAFQVLQIDGALRLRFTVSQDRSRSCVFGFDRGNLAAYSYRTSRPTASYFYAGGQGEGVERVVEESGSDRLPTERRELFLDQRSVAELPLLRQKIAEARVDHQTSSSLSLTPLDDPDTRYGEAYNLDDLVAVRLPSGATILDRVGEVRLTVTGGPGGSETLRPIVASDGTELSGLNLTATLRRLGRRLTNVETRN